MYKSIILSTALLFSVISIASCGGSKEESKKGIFQCPMKCEGEKTYPESGSCPVCKMDLKEIESE